jgi:hypothetical protein
MEATFSATQPAKSISVLDAVICIAEAANQASPQNLQRYSHNVRFSTNESTDGETDEINIQELQLPLNQVTYDNVKTEDYLNIDTEAETL